MTQDIEVAYNIMEYDYKQAVKMYIFRDKLDADAHDKFISQSEFGNLLQSSRWSQIKNNWDHAIVGVFDGDLQLAASLVLIKHLPLGFTMMYIPRGPIMDYGNSELVVFFFKELKRWAKKYRCLFVKVDPPVLRGRYKELGVPVLFDTGSEALDNIEIVGLKHIGFTLGMSATIQPRFNMVCHKDEFGEDYLSKKGRKNYRTAIKNKYLQTLIVDKSGLDDFDRVMNCTADRQGVALRDRQYYELLLDIYGEDAFLTLTYMDIKGEYEEALALRDKCLEDIENCPDTAPKKKFKLEENLASYTRRVKDGESNLAKYGDKQCIAGALSVIFGETAELLYAGADNDFRRFMAPYKTWFSAIETSFDRGCKYVNLGGISGYKDDGLQEFKSAFNPYIHEYLGEFDLPVSKLLYAPSRWMFDKRKGV